MVTKKHPLKAVKKVIKKELSEIALTIAEKVIQDIRDGVITGKTHKGSKVSPEVHEAVRSPKKAIKKMARRAVGAKA
jgi:hypothetical protein